MTAFTVQLPKSCFVIIAKSNPGCVHCICEPCPSCGLISGAISFASCAFIIASLFDCSPGLHTSFGPAGLLRFWSCVSELWAHWQPKPREQHPRGVGAQQWQWANETFIARERPPFPYNGKVKWFVSEYGHILLIKPTQKRQHCNIFQWLFIMNYVSLSLNCYYFSLMLLGACIIYSIGSCGTMK